MKKFLALALVLGSSIMFVPAAAQAKTAESGLTASFGANTAAEPQTYRQRTRWNQRYNRRGARVVTRTRTIRVGGRLYREVVQYRYLPNGRVTVRVLSRTRIR